MFKESVKMSWQNIIHNKMRSFLTVLGIVIGVASVIALITIVQGTTASVTSKVTAMGANKVLVTVRGTALKAGLLDSDVRAIAALDNVEGISPTISSVTSVVGRRIVMEDVTLQGKNEAYFTHTEDLLASGRAINVLDCDSRNKVCLVGAEVAETLFYGENPVGQELAVGGVTYRIVGVLQKSEGFSLSSNDRAVLIPYTTAMRFAGTRYINSVDVYVKDGTQAADTTNRIQAVVNRAFNYSDKGYTVTNMQDILDTVKEMTGMLSLMLAGIASISLIVGGIGIMNMMLVSVTERTTEIGLRKALGAQPSRIRQQFILEAIFLSLFGGVLGLGLGAAIAYAACAAIGSVFSVSLSTVALALGFSAAIGIIFGYAPARKASRLNPIDALRSV